MEEDHSSAVCHLVVVGIRLGVEGIHSLVAMIHWVEARSSAVYLMEVAEIHLQVGENHSLVALSHLVEVMLKQGPH